MEKKVVLLTKGVVFLTTPAPLPPSSYPNNSGAAAAMTKTIAAAYSSSNGRAIAVNCCYLHLYCHCYNWNHCWLAGMLVSPTTSTT